jgi:hypothetical protein
MFARQAILVAMLVSAPALSRADFIGPNPWSYTLQAGPMFPAGQEGAGLDPGPHLGGILGYEVNPAFILGADLSLVRSQDDLRTHIAALGARGRLSPSPDFTHVYVVGGIAAHGIFYNPSDSQSEPPSRLRFGGSFGFGADVVTHEKMAFGLEALYHGIIMDAGDALSYITVGLYASFRPGAP